MKGNACQMTPLREARLFNIQIMQDNGTVARSLYDARQAHPRLGRQRGARACVAPPRQRSVDALERELTHVAGEPEQDPEQREPHAAEALARVQRAEKHQRKHQEPAAQEEVYGPKSKDALCS